MKQASSILSVASPLIGIKKNLLAERSAKKITTSLLLLAVVSCSFFSCTKSGLKPSQPDQTLAAGGGNGGGGNGGGGNGGGGNNPVPPSAPAPTTTPTSLSISEVVTNGTWKIYSYTEKTENSTKKFDNISFTFSSNLSLTAQDGSKATTGSWYAAQAIFYYGVPAYGSNPNGFFLNLGSSLPLTLLSKNFFVSFKGLTTFTLESINPQEDTHVTFTR